MKTIKLFPILGLLMFGLLISCDKNKDGELSPTIVSTNPTDDETGVFRNSVVTVNFSEAMDSTTINTTSFTLTQGGTSVAGAVTYTGLTATFTPTVSMDVEEDYTAKISKSAESVAGYALESDHSWSFTTGGSSAGIEAVNLVSAGNYVILAKTAINNAGTSAITGDMGLSPAATSYITGLTLTDGTGNATSDMVTGFVYASDMADPTPSNLTTAVNDMTTAYNDAAGRTLPDFTELGTGDIGGETLTPGLYNWTNTVTIPSTVTISGNATDIWIFQIAGNLSTSSDVEVLLIGGAQAQNIFWQVAGQVTLGTTSHFEGVVLSMTGITLETGASVNGRLLAQTAVILDGNTVTEP